MWPLSEEGLLFLWQTAAAANLVRHPVSGAERAPKIQAEGRAAPDHDFALAPAGGRFAVGRGSTVLSTPSAPRDSATGALAWAATRVNIQKTGRWERVPKFENAVPELPQDEEQRIIKITA